MRDPETGQFTRAEGKGRNLTHPALRPPKKAPRVDMKQKRTTVRSMKLVNATDPDRPQLIQVPIEPGHNNRGTLKDPTIPIRHYLEKGFIQPHEFQGQIMVDGEAVDLQRVFCAIKDCWDTATITFDEGGTERCGPHDKMFNDGLIRYATAAREYKE